jgi:GntR family transcriptional regulator, transcriptional repressor for pyruvate dehydrogenase complex
MIPADIEGEVPASQAGERKAQPGKRKALPGGVAQQIEDWVREERFGPGNRLPSERELAIRIGTSRNVVREALRILETRGVVEVRHGIGTFAINNPADTQPRFTVNFDLRAEQLSESEILVARRAIECAVVTVATRACDTFDLEELHRLVDVAARAVEAEDRARFVAADLEFHEALGTCTHNSMLRQVQLEVIRATRAVQENSPGTRDAMQATVWFHREIAGACAKGDEDAARAIMLLHLIDPRADVNKYMAATTNA